jgi:transcriptional regulator with XRE-family HTH domain
MRLQVMATVIGKDSMDIAQAIKDYRLKHSLSQREVAVQLGVSAMQVMRWENAKTRPNILSTKAIQELLKEPYEEKTIPSKHHT